MVDLELGLVGNGTVAALIDRRATIVWACLPQFDGDPTFTALVDGTEPADGFFAVELVGGTGAPGGQSYLRNSAVLRTEIANAAGDRIEVVDFAPRFVRYGRQFHPAMLFRIVRPLAGRPLVRVRVRPRFETGSVPPVVTRGSNHLRYAGPRATHRLTTDLPVAYVADETAFRLDRPGIMVFGVDEPFSTDLSTTAQEFLAATDAGWRDFARGLALPFDWQDAVVRAAITLKLCTFEETGAIIAAPTTSIPESADSGRTWDYRYCWLRDAYFVVRALNRLGATRTMEGYLRYIDDVLASADGGPLPPVHAIARTADLTERMAPHLAGYRGMGPVRFGNQAVAQLQNDSFGAVILAAAQTFFDTRLEHPGERDHFRRLEALGHRAVAAFGVPDAGLWEFRGTLRPHTFTAVMCWAGCDRLARIAGHLGLEQEAAHWSAVARTMRDAILDRAWDAGRESFVDTLAEPDGVRDPPGRLDACLLLLPDLGLIPADDPRFLATLAAVERHLLRDGFVMRYAEADDFGEPETAFVVCSFWYVDALAAVGRRDEACALFERLLSVRTSLGLLAEDVDPRTGTLWGNFPQTYSMVGLINAALRLSRPWESAL
jgi:GH15 family glucan-1,4-alpha-glucosidase